MYVCVYEKEKRDYVQGELDYISNHQVNTLDTDLNKI